MQSQVIVKQHERSNSKMRIEERSKDRKIISKKIKK